MIRRKRQNIGVVVPARELCLVHVVNQRGSHPGKSIRGIHHPETASANHDPALGLSVRNRARGRRREYRIVDGVCAVGSVIANRVSAGLEFLAQLDLQPGTAVVARHDDQLAHHSALLLQYPTSKTLDPDRREWWAAGPRQTQFANFRRSSPAPQPRRVGAHSAGSGVLLFVNPLAQRPASRWFHRNRKNSKLQLGCESHEPCWPHDRARIRDRVGPD